MKAGWQQTTLGSIAQIGAGNSAPQGDALFADGVHPFFRTSDAGRVRFGDIAESTDYLNDEGIKGLRRFPAGTILFPKSGASTFLNHRVMMAVEGYVSSHLATIVGDESKVSRRYLLYFLSTVSAQDLVQDHAYPSLNLPLISGIPVSLPPLPEQQRIVGILDDAFDGIATAKANAEQNLQNARALFESHLQSVFTQAPLSGVEGRGDGWAEKRLQDVCEKITDGTHQTPKYFEEGVIFLSSRNVTSGKINWDNIKYIDTKQHLEMHKRVAPKVNDILLAKNGTTGVAAIVDRDVVFDIYVSLALIRTLGLVSPKFLLYFINSPVAKYQFNKRLKGVGVPNLHLEEIREVVIGFPLDVREQEAIVAKLDALHEETQRLESLYQRKLAALAELKKSLLHQAFSGAL